MTALVCGGGQKERLLVYGDGKNVCGSGSDGNVCGCGGNMGGS